MGILLKKNEEIAFTTKTRLVLSVLIFMLLVVPRMVHADMILVGAPVWDGSSSWDTQSGFPPSGTVFDFADQFSLSSDQFVTDIRVPLFGAAGFLSTNFNLSLLNAPPASNPTPLFSFDLTLPDTTALYVLPIDAVLSSGTYYLRLSTDGFVGWFVADPSSFVTTFGNVVDGIWEVNTSVGTWSFLDSGSFSGAHPGQFSVNGPDVSVPEPGSLILLVMGIAVAIRTKRRQERR